MIAEVPVLRVEGVSKSFRREPRPMTPIAEATLNVGAGELIAIRGRRRTGKTTLLGLASGLIVPDAGRVRFLDYHLALLSDRQLTDLRAKHLGWVPPAEEMYGLVNLHAAEYVRFRLCCTQLAPRDMRAVVRDTLEWVGASRCAKLPLNRLSDHERVLVQLAGAIAQQRVLLVIDEPTLGLDADERDHVLELLREVVRRGTSVLMATSDSPTAYAGDAIYTLRHGRLIAPETPPEDGGGRVIRFPARR